MSKLNANCYLVLKPTHVANGVVREINIARMTKTPPHLDPGEIAIKVRVNIEPGSFEPSLAQVDVGPSDPTWIPAVTVEADDD